MWVTSSLSLFSARCGWLSKLFSVALLYSIAFTASAEWCVTPSENCDEGKALKNCVSSLERSQAEAIIAGGSGDIVSNCTRTGTATGFFTCSVKYSGSVWKCNAPNGTMQTSYHFNQLCTSRPNQTGWKHDPAKPSVCYDGCTYESILEIDIESGSPNGTRYYKTTGATCRPTPETPPPEDCPLSGCEPDDDDDPCPAGTSDKGDGNCTPDGDDDGDDDGSGSCPGNKVDPNNSGNCSCPAGLTDPDGDNTCTNPNGDGDGDDDGDGDGNGTSTGGDDCTAGPVSTGGDPLLHAVIRHSWLVRCGKSKSDANGDGRPDWTELKPGDTPTDDGNSPTENRVSRITVALSNIDTSGFLGGGSCPSFGSISFGRFGTYSLDEPYICTIINVARALIILFGAYTAIRILLGA